MFILALYNFEHKKEKYVYFFVLYDDNYLGIKK